MSLPGLALSSGINSDLRSVNRGALSIAGTTKVAGVATPCRVHLHRETDGVMIGYRRSGVDGSYSFPNLAAGDYYLVITDDRQNVKRSKVEHVTLT